MTTATPPVVEVLKASATAETSSSKSETTDSTRPASISIIVLTSATFVPAWDSPEVAYVRLSRKLEAAVSHSRGT